MNLNKKTKKQIMGLIIFAGIVLWIVFNYKLFFDLVSFIIKLIMPIIVGVAIAFIINVPLKQIERKIFKVDKRKHKKLIRVISLFLSIILIFGIVGLLMFLVIPEFIEAINSIGKTIPSNIEWLNNLNKKISNLYPSFNNYIKDIDLKKVLEVALGTTGNMVSIIISFISNLLSKVLMFFIGFILAIYILLDKENLVRQIKMLLNAFLQTKTVNKIGEIVKLTNSTFTNFLTGQCLDALVLGIIFFITMTILKMPYALIISVLLAVTALIPYIGAFITLVVGAILIAVTSPIKAVWYVVMFFVLQQIDENILVPKIVGKSVGLPALWTLIAALIGGSMLGIIGVIISIPISSVLYSLLKEWVKYKSEKKQDK